MNRFSRHASALLALALFVTIAPQPGSAQASAAPAAANAPSSEQTIHGRITATDGRFNIRIHDDSGYNDSVQLHRGTIINPTGLTLEVGMRVRILGYNAGDVFAANEIDTPYRFAGPPPPAMYYGPGWWYPGYIYGYGPAFSLNFRTGGNLHQGPFPHTNPVVRPPNPLPHVGGPFVGNPGAPPPGRRS
jgi:hypothetical protein